MSAQDSVSVDEFRALDAGFARKVFYVFAVLAALSAGISFGGKWLGRSIAMGGHTDDTTIHEIVIGNNVVSVPANEIRFERSRIDGVASRLDLYFRWPDMAGYSDDARSDFNHAGGRRNIVFASIDPSVMSRDMSGRFEPIYRSMIVGQGSKGPSGSRLFAFDPKSGYVNELLVVAPRAGQDPFVARCLTGPAAADSLAPCERDIHLGDGLTVTYRFPGELIGEWSSLESKIVAKFKAMLKSEGPAR